MIDDELKQEIFPVVFLTIVVCISVIALSIVNSITEDKIEEAKQEAIDKMLEEQFPEMAESDYDDDIEVYTILDENDSIAGYAFMTEAGGYGGPIEILVALENFSLEVEEIEDGDIVLRGISVISHTETPGLGAKIEENSFLKKFEGISIIDVKFTRDGGQVDAISGATISSSAVVDAVHDDAVAKAKAILKAKEKKAAGGEV